MIPLQLSPFANHLWQSTVFAGAAALLAMMLRRNRAQVRYRIWLLASAKFLMPLSLLLSVGRRIEWKVAPIAATPVTVAVGQLSQPFDVTMPTTAAAVTWPSMLFLAWLCGSVVVALSWWVRWRRVRAAMRNASRLPIPGPVEVLSSQTRLEPGIFGIVRPVLLVPDGITDRLTPEQFSAILAHEFCHVRRRDNVVAAFHMVVEALFWFHPLVWWIGARMIEAREQACDEEVLREGNDPEVYAAGILKVCRFYLESPLPCASGVTGADLNKRIAAIMTGRVLDRLTVSRKFLIALAGIAAVAGPIVIGIVNAQSQTLRFEVASIRPTKSDGMKGGLELLPGGGLRMGGVSLKMLVAMAYDVRDEQITGGPKWIGSETYNIQAKAEDPTPADHAGKTVAPGTAAWNRMTLRLQTLLTERFQLAFHKDKKEASGYLLLVAKGGSKMQVSADQGNASTMRSPGQINARRGTMPMLATVLTGFLQRPVVDRTGLDGAYDYKLEYAQEPGATADASVFTALQEQLGLKLESSRVTTTTIVIERADRPSGN